MRHKMKFDEIYKKVIDSCREFEERQVPILLDFKIEDLRDALVESNDTIEKLKRKLQDQCISCPVKMQEDDVVAEKDNEIRRLKRALYKACANWSFTMDDLLTNKILDGNHSDKLRFTRDRWWRMSRKCQAKAEEYK